MTTKLSLKFQYEIIAPLLERFWAHLLIDYHHKIRNINSLLEFLVIHVKSYYLPDFYLSICLISQLMLLNLTIDLIPAKQESY